MTKNWNVHWREMAWPGRRRIVSTLFRWLICAAALALLPGCGTGDGGSTTARLAYLIPPDAILPGPNGDAKLMGEDPTGVVISAKSLTWTSSDNSIVTVDANGNLTPVSDGEAIITATQPSTGNSAHADITVNVNTSSATDVSIPPDTSTTPTIPSTPPIVGPFVREAPAPAIPVHLNRLVR